MVPLDAATPVPNPERPNLCDRIMAGEARGE